MLITRGRRVFLFGQRSFSRIQDSFALRQLLFFLRLTLGIETLLHLAVDVGLTFGVSLLFLTRTEDRQCDHRGQSKEFLHVRLRPLFFFVIRNLEGCPPRRPWTRRSSPPSNISRCCG